MTRFPRPRSNARWGPAPPGMGFSRGGRWIALTGEALHRTRFVESVTRSLTEAASQWQRSSSGNPRRTDQGDLAAHSALTCVGLALAPHEPEQRPPAAVAGLPRRRTAASVRPCDRVRSCARLYGGLGRATAPSYANPRACKRVSYTTKPARCVLRTTTERFLRPTRPATGAGTTAASSSGGGLPRVRHRSRPLAARVIDQARLRRRVAAYGRCAYCPWSSLKSCLPLRAAALRGDWAPLRPMARFAADEGECTATELCGRGS